MKHAIYTLLITVAACGKGESNDNPDSDAVIDSPFLSESTFEKSTHDFPTVGSGAALLEKLNNSRFLYSSVPSSGLDRLDKCLVSEVSGSKLSDIEGKLVLGSTYDLRSCLSNEDVDYSLAKVKFYYEYSCPENDLENMNGEKLNSSFKIDEEIDCNEAKVLWNIEGNYSGITKLSTGSELLLNFTRRIYVGTSATKSCKFTNRDDITSIDDGCIFKDSKKIEKMEVDGVATEDELIGDDLVVFKPTSVKVEETSNSKWYSSGKMTGSFNQWEGTVTYSDGKPIISFVRPNGFTTTGSLGIIAPR